jgi:S1-C subfamily serine protease
MRKQVLYSSSGPKRRPPGMRPEPPPQAATAPEVPPEMTADPPDQPAATATVEHAVPAKATAPRRGRVFRTLVRHERWLSMVLAVAIGFAIAVGWSHWRPARASLTQKDIDRAVLHTLATKSLPSRAAKAYDKIRPSVVRVKGYNGGESGDPQQTVTGSGVILIEDGTILTSLHVAAAAKELKVVFDDGHQSEAYMLAAQPENDLAVIRATSLPDDVKPATMRSTADLRPGDEVIAVGFPFGIGPSVSAGVVSGLNREFQTPDGEKVLKNLIQFDAAANPGSSGGPLVTYDGEVVGIVTAILNPGRERTFVGIGFAVPIESASAGAGLHPF